MVDFLSPALNKKERRLLFKILFPSSILFFGGCAFSYHFIVPVTLKTLYIYPQYLEAAPLFSVKEFLSVTFALMLVAGIMFLLPVFMVLMSYLKIVPARFWQDNWRYAVLIFLIVCALITPDGTGISMVMLSAPLSLLYGFGIIISRRKY